MYQVTLGIPIYNAADLIEETILSALNQTFPDIDFLFIDDKGDSMDIVRRVIAEHPRGKNVRIIDQIYNQGVGAARNAIIDNALGEYLFTMDCDDVITPDCIQILYTKMKEHPVDLVAASFVRRDMQGNIYPNCQYGDVIRENEEFPLVKFRYVEGQNFSVASWNKLYRLSFLKENNIRCVPHFHVEDPWFTYQVILCAKSFRLIPNVTLKFTFNPSSVTSRKEAEGYSEFIGSQFVQTEKLKADYIVKLAQNRVYTSLLVDLMKMSIYHAYRIALSTRISRQKKQQMLDELLSRFFVASFSCSLNGTWIKYILFYLFYALPLSLKKWIILCSAKMKLQYLFRRWIHFH